MGRGGINSVSIKVLAVKVIKCKMNDFLKREILILKGNFYFYEHMESFLIRNRTLVTDIALIALVQFFRVL